MSDILHSVNILSAFATDAYKVSHYFQMPPHSEASRLYLAPRKPYTDDINEYTIFGIRYFIEKYLQKPLTTADIQRCKSLMSVFNVGASPYPFPEKGLNKIVSHYNGYLPLTITGVREGHLLKDYNLPLIVVGCDDPDLVWLPGFIETAFQRSIWYPSTVATISKAVRAFLFQSFQKSVDEANFPALDYKLHDFGARGATSGESAALGGLAHLLNFNGTDTMEAVFLGHTLYGSPVSDLAASIPAAEHSTVTSWGEDINAEREALINLIEQCHRRGDKMFSFVSDSYDFYQFVDNVWGDPAIIKLINDYKLNPVVRPDSGDPIEVVLYALNSLAKSWGYTVNSKGYKVLNTIRIIQGDGMTISRITNLVNVMLEQNFSAENVSFGMGGGLLQKFDRDSMSWSMKMYKIKVAGQWRDVRKKPVTQNNKIAYNPANIVDDSDWVVHYELKNGSPTIYNEDFVTIKNRVRQSTAL
ncbi:MAG: nicotinate phosphoribosyltransferase [Brevinema sp.]